MEIKTKYNIGDKVYLRATFGGCVADVVSRIVADVSEDGVMIRYQLRCGASSSGYSEDGLAADRKDVGREIIDRLEKQILETKKEFGL